MTLEEELAYWKAEARFWQDIDLARPSVQEPMEYVWRGGEPKPHDPEWARCQKWMADDPKGFGTQLAGVQKLHQQTVQAALARDEVRDRQARRIEELEAENASLKEQLAAHSVVTTRDQGTERITELIDRLLEEDRLQREARNGQ